MTVEKLRELGAALYQQGRYAEAEDILRRALALARRSGDREASATLLNNLGRVVLDRGRQDDAERLLRESLVSARAAGLNRIEVYALINLGGALIAKGEPATAETVLRRGLAVARRCELVDAEGAAHIALAQLAKRADNLAGAIIGARRAAHAAKRDGNRSGQVAALSFLALCYQRANLPGIALEAARRGLAVARSHGIVDQQLPLLRVGFLAASAQAQSWPSAAHLAIQIEIGEELLAAALGEGDTDQIASTTDQLAEAKEVSRRMEELAERQQVGEAVKVVPGSEVLAYQEAVSVLSRLAAELADRGDLVGALELCEDSRSLAARNGDPALQGRSLRTLATLYLTASQPREVATASLELRKLAEDAGDEELVAWSLLLLGTARFHLGDAGSARSSLLVAWERAEPLNRPDLSAAILSGLGLFAVAEGKLEEAEEHWRRQLALLEAAPPPPPQPSQEETLSTLLEQAAQQGLDSEAAARILTEDPAATRILTELGALGERGEALAEESARVERQQQALVRGSLAWVLAMQGRTDEAFELLAAVPELIAEGSSGDRAAAQETRGYVLFQAAQSARRGDERARLLKEAENHLDRAVAEYETLRSGLGAADRFKISVQDVFSIPSELLQLTLVSAGEIGQALEAAEHARGLAFADRLAQLPGRAPVPGIDTPTIDEELSIEEIKALARRWDATLVIYSVLYDPTALLVSGRIAGKQFEHEQTLLIWGVDPSGRIALSRVDLEALGRRPERTSLTRLVQAAHKGLTVAGGGSGSGVVGTRGATDHGGLAELADLLIKPVLPLLPKAGRLVVAPSGFLFLVPFAALPAFDGEPLAMSHSLVTTPSLRVLASLPQGTRHDSREEPDALVVGDPTLPAAGYSQRQQLPSARREAMRVADLLQGERLIGDQATKAAVVRGMRGKRLIHIACHGVLEKDGLQPADRLAFGDGRLHHPGSIPGALVLASESGDGLLTSGEVSAMQLQADLVVLSACHTGSGEISGDGVLGLARAFLTAGAAAVLVSLWAVDDEATADLMERFYTQLRSSDSYADALRRAMLAVRDNNPEPSLWSGFHLVGRP